MFILPNFDIFVIGYWIVPTFIAFLWQMLLSLVINNHFLADVIALGCIWLMLLATVADVKATFYCVNPQCWFGRCYCHICLADVFCHSGWCVYHSCVGWCFCQLILMEQPFVVTAINGLICGRWNGHCFVTGWCYCHGGRCYCHWLVCVRQMLLPWWQML